MMTPKQAVQMYLRDGDKEIVMAEIQRDAREGMVDADDMRRLVNAFMVPTPNGDDDLEELCAKYPNLFPK